MNIAFSLLVTAIVSTSVFYALLPRLVRASAKAVGWRVRKRTSTRKSLLIARANTEKKQHEDRNSSQTSLDDEWERVERSGSDSNEDVKTEGRASKDWDGLVGFLHPFW